MTDISKAFVSFGLLLFFVSTLLQVSAQQQDVTIKGKFKNWPKQRHLIISYSEGTESVSDTVTVKYGKFSYKKTFLDPTELSLYYDGTDLTKEKDSRRLLAVKGKIQLHHLDSLKRAVLQGPRATMEFEELKNLTDPIRNKLVSLRLQAQELMKAGHKVADHPQLDVDFKAGVASLRQVYKDFVRSHSSSIVALEAVKQLDGTNYSDPAVYELYKSLAASVKESPAGIEIQRKFEIGLKTSMGTVLESFSSLDTARKPLTLDEVKGKGKVTLVDFWASWCKPCRAENPHLRKVYAEFHHKGFSILAVSLDRSLDAWKNAIKQDQLPWYHVSSLQYWEEPIVKQFGISGVPDSFLLDEDGRIIGRGLRGDMLYEAVKAALTPAQTVPLDSAGVVAEQSRFRNEKDYETKLSIYNRLLKEPVFLNTKFADVSIGGMQRDFAVAYAEKGNVTGFQSWINKMTAPVMRRVAISQGYEALSKNTAGPDFLRLIRPQLDSLLHIQPWSNDGINLYSDLVTLYLKAIKVPENAADVVRYVEPWYKAQGNYFPKDLMTNFDELADGIKGSFSYRYALALSIKREISQAFDVLAKATEIGVFSVTDIASFAAEMGNIPNLKARIEQHLASSRSEYATKVKALLQKNTIEGKPYDVKKMQARYILLDFWGSWCIPCRASHPKLVDLYTKYKDKGLEIISVSQEAPASMDKMQANWKKAVTHDNMTWIQILNNEGIESFDAVKEFAIAVFPTKILLDKNLNKIEIYQGGASTAQLESKIVELLGTN